LGVGGFLFSIRQAHWRREFNTLKRNDKKPLFERELSRKIPVGAIAECISIWIGTGNETAIIIG